MKTYKIGLVYIGQGVDNWFQSVTVVASSRLSAFNTAAGSLKPNHLQTLTLIEVK